MLWYIHLILKEPSSVFLLKLRIRLSRNTDLSEFSSQLKEESCGTGCCYYQNMILLQTVDASVKLFVVSGNKRHRRLIYASPALLSCCWIKQPSDIVTIIIAKINMWLGVNVYNSVPTGSFRLDRVSNRGMGCFTDADLQPTWIKWRSLHWTSFEVCVSHYFISQSHMWK